MDPEADPVQRLAWQLRRLRERAGSPSYHALAQRAHYSASTLAEAAKGDRLASPAVTLAYVEACGGDRVGHLVAVGDGLHALTEGGMHASRRSIS
ncbi:helix-turn-helix domain-containing protein [Streptomyces phyllanthi]|uniref:helix-turn-helix domain-containing protein n=1 Tax=Streptomyces phyllanthi TaxID=1803180 RepID=UPI00128C0FAF